MDPGICWVEAIPPGDAGFSWIHPVSIRVFSTLRFANGNCNFGIRGAIVEEPRPFEFHEPLDEAHIANLSGDFVGPVRCEEISVAAFEHASGIGLVEEQLA